MSVTFVMSSKASVVVRVYAVAVWDVAVRVTRSRAPNMRSMSIGGTASSSLAGGG